MFHFSENIAFGGLKHRKSLDNEDNWVIVNVSKSSFEEDEYHFPLNDGAFDSGGNSQQEFAEVVNLVREHIQNNERIFIHCAAGESRSVSVLSTALAAEHKREFDSVRDELMKIRRSDYEPAESLQKKARTYLRHTKD